MHGMVKIALSLTLPAEMCWKENCRGETYA